jgi:hypothetical protein
VRGRVHTLQCYHQKEEQEEEQEEGEGDEGEYRSPT